MERLMGLEPMTFSLGS